MKKTKKYWLCIVVFTLLCSSLFPSSKTTVSSAKTYQISTSDIDAKASMFVDASLEFGVPASILISLSIHETSLGTTGVGKSLNNWFGMMATSLYPTDPSYTGRFEKYPNATASIRDAARLLGSPKASYKITNIIINNKGLDGAYDKIARSITAHWCVNEPGKPCTYDAQALLDTMEQYDLKKYDEELKKLSVEDLKNVVNKYYGPNAIPIPGYDGVQGGWNGDYTDPDTSNNVADGVYFNSSYTGDVTKGYLYQKYAGTDLWENMLLDADEAKASEVVRSILVQGEELYGDGNLHADDFIWNGTDEEAPENEISGEFSGMPLPSISCYSSPFGYRGNIGVAGASTNHKGIDLPAVMNTPIFTVADGKVVLSRWYGSGGNTVIVEHANGVRTLYMHMSRANVTVGTTVLAGDTIGFVGSTGASSGPHLHFQIEINGTAVDPQKQFSYLANLKKC